VLEAKVINVYFMEVESLVLNRIAIKVLEPKVINAKDMVEAKDALNQIV
jgi:hypothetical protein